jgi:hypothetical protein
MKFQISLLRERHLNARTGNLLDFITQDSVRESFSDCPLPDTYVEDHFIARQQLDKTSNYHGNLLTEICKSNNLRLLNGRFLGDSIGFYTFYNSNGKSTVDYMLASSILYTYIEYFCISPPNELSDHCLLSTGIKLSTRNTNVNSDKYNMCADTFIWSQGCEERYLDAILDEESVNDLAHLHHMLDDSNFSEVNTIVSTLTNIYNNAGYKILRLRKPHYAKFKQRQNRKAKPKKVWMTTDCLKLKTG